MIYKGNSFKDLWELSDEERHYYLDFAEWYNDELTKKMKQG